MPDPMKQWRREQREQEEIADVLGGIILWLGVVVVMLLIARAIG